MAHKSRYAEHKVLDMFLGGQAFTPPSSVYLALLTTNPSDDTMTGLVEVSASNWTNYARQGQVSNLTNFPAASGGAKTNANAFDFGTATTTGNVTLSGWALYDAASSGNVLYWNAFGAPQPVVQNGNPVSVPAGNLDITED